MSLTIFNGSPRGKSSNSTLISKWFSEGYGHVADTRYLNLAANIPENITAFCEAEALLMVFPLYVDGMPGQVKAFIEALIPYKNHVTGKKITFIIHSGFSEGRQNRALENYLNRFAEIFELKNHGIIILPGSEGFRLLPPAATKKKHQAITRMGLAFRQERAYSEDLLKKANPKEAMGIWSQYTFRFFSKLGLTNMYWDNNLKKNNAFKKRFDAPYAAGPVEVPENFTGYVRNY